MLISILMTLIASIYIRDSQHGCHGVLSGGLGETDDCKFNWPSLVPASSSYPAVRDQRALWSGGVGCDTVTLFITNSEI